MHWIYSFCPALGVVATSFFCGIFIRELGLGDSFDLSPHQFVDYSLVPFSLVPVSPFGFLSCIDSDLSSFSRKRILSDFHPYDISGSSDGLDRCERSAWLASVSSVGCRVAWDHHAFAQEAMAAAAVAAPRVLNIAERQVLRFFANDPAGLAYHHRILFHQVEGSRWVVGTPDGEVEEDDFRGVHIIPLRKGGTFPDYVPPAQIYAFDPLDPQELAELRTEARDVALALGCDLNKAVIQAESKWLIADTDSSRWGEEVPPQDLGDAARTVQLGEFALHTLYPGEDNEQVVKLELVGNDDVAEWRAQKAPGVVDAKGREVRLLGNITNSRGVRSITFAKAVELMKPPGTSPDAWKLRGPAVFMDLCDTISQSGADFETYFAQWHQTSGLSENSAAYHEAKHIMGFIHAGLQVDQVDGSNLLCMERAARRFIEIQSAVKRNPKHPDFMGLGFGTQTTLDESGAIRTGAYHEWLAEQQKVEGRLYKYGREHREELAAEKKRQAGGQPAGGAPGGGGAARGGAKSWKKGKNAAGAGQAPADP